MARDDFPEWMTDRRWWRLCDCHASAPVPLTEADVSKSFVYSRRWGFLYVGFGHHQMTMATLLAFEQDHLSPLDILGVESLNKTADLAEQWLRTAPGAAYRSGVAKCVLVGNPEHLTDEERALFSPFLCPFED